MPWARSPAELVQRASPGLLTRAIGECREYGCLRWMTANKPFLFLVLYIVCYLIVGVLTFMSLEDWTFTQSLYFNIITVTTIGYGDLSPTSADSRVFSVFHMTFGLVLFTLVLGSRVRSVEDQNTVLQRHLRVQDMIGGRKATGSSYKFWQGVSRLLFIYVIMLMIGSLYFCLGLGYEFHEGLYLATTTGTSVGYGDVSPSITANSHLSYGGMWFTIFYSVIFFLFTGQLLGWVASQLFSLGIRYDVQSSLRGSLSQRLLEALDKNNDHVVDRAEWMQAVLLANDVCTPELIDLINKRFHELDADHSGGLTIRDLSPVLQEDDEAEAEAGDGPGYGETELRHNLERVSTADTKAPVSPYTPNPGETIEQQPLPDTHAEQEPDADAE
ncbi:hypothetical protein PTSG_07874 [Salpingoeca rosetta]|uniref:Potassium channel domain-containing protein n=1 Tax=Salpingoeca rosetta (strain ATCC 50818 / BSB-021) TaxID=946362 RepID=F2UGK7_SALR5|nr:uncharacterized protein PTSG_07874 [Salpingoeca rosetta]EGD75757.1 hypothetical protein PTSG_07874 [Salpingoeca rosetta]|eukprot:XP_004991678.1 hypothetical protein PTSG_07874 [Salpingoeca rosetta]